MNKNLTSKDVDLLEQWWVEKSRKNFFAYRQYIRHGEFKFNWFTVDLCRQLQQFYIDYLAGERPVLIITTPPQHGKSMAITDFITWVLGLDPYLRIIYGSYSDDLGVRCNLDSQRIFDTDKHQSIFPDFQINRKGGNIQASAPKRNNYMVQSWSGSKKSISMGYLHNVTVQGGVTGKTTDIGIIDDPVKGRAEANSPLVSQRIWEWFENDFSTRFDDKAGLIVIMTRWTTHDLTARLVDYDALAKLKNYKAIATDTEEHRDTGEVLFPQHKTKEFLEKKKKTTSQAVWESLYQGQPTVAGGNMFKDSWWQWWKTGALPPLKYKYITVDTAQKTRVMNDWTVFQCWGYGIDGRIYLLDKFRNKVEAPELRREAVLFYQKHDTKKKKVDDPILRGMYIEDKSSGVGLIQELKRKRLKIFQVPRNTDKILRAEDASPYIESGLVVLNTEISGIDNLTKEGREFPNSQFDDDIDTCITAIEIAFINKKLNSSLLAAMEAD